MPGQFNFKELFNSNTVRGRANCAKATWASVGLIYVLVKMHRYNAELRESAKYCKGCQRKMCT
ncbi:putative 60S ribosomal protein L33 [Drosophila grimshawi]|uniref:GH17592 n=1 Tax=Drosophila grimshawi TaxID=7222 RepID=B4JXD0_DROGR|nr:putative 60S ribosomal protein L33 [Drosophila grimshawi]EDV95406.1 GH17592 [Drosophila grimshawi]